MTCPLQAKFKYSLHLPEQQSASASFGKIIHSALQLYNEVDDIDVTVEKFKEWWESPELLGVAPDYWPKGTDYGSLRELGQQILLEYHSSLQWDERTVVATEHGFLVPFGRHELTGYVDLLELRRSGNGRRLLRLIDYKTNSRQPWKSELFFDVQFTVYAYASLQPEFWLGNGPNFPGIPNGQQLFEEFEKVPRRPIWYHLRTAREFDCGKRDDEQYRQLYRLCDEIEKAEEQQVFVPRIGESSCKWCSYINECGLAIPTEDEVREQESAWI
jgi:PD-(D/E)XK nuclease superfamily protein